MSHGLLSSQGVLHFDEDARKVLLTANGDFTVGVVQYLLSDRSKSRVEITDPRLDPEPEALNPASARHRTSKSTKQESDDEYWRLTEGSEVWAQEVCGSGLQYIPRASLKQNTLRHASCCTAACEY